MAMHGCPSIVNEIGFAPMLPLLWNSQSSSPVVASGAKKCQERRDFLQ
jgi:hypothetical protein